jgi:hypothetical protein
MNIHVDQGVKIPLDVDYENNIEACSNLGYLVVDI